MSRPRRDEPRERVPPSAGERALALASPSPARGRRDRSRRGGHAALAAQSRRAAPPARAQLPAPPLGRPSAARRWLVAVVALAATLVATGPLAPVAAAADKPRVVTTFTVIADMARNVAGDAADVVSVTKPGAEIHGYQPTPKDIGRTRDADLVLWNGLNLELWFEKFLARLGDVPSATLSDGVEPIAIGGGDYAGKPNPHAWMSPEAALVYVDNIRDALIGIDPGNEAIYAANAEAYQGEIRAVVEPLRQALAEVPEERRWLVTSEGAFSYLARDLGLRELYLWPMNADSQGTPQQVRAVIDTVREHGIPVVFSESTVSDKPARQVARETGADYGGVLYVDSLSAADGEVPTYLDLLRVTTERIASGLLGRAADR